MSAGARKLLDVASPARVGELTDSGQLVKRDAPQRCCGRVGELVRSVAAAAKCTP